MQLHCLVSIAINKIHLLVPYSSLLIQSIYNYMSIYNSLFSLNILHNRKQKNIYSKQEVCTFITTQILSTHAFRINV